MPSSKSLAALLLALVLSSATHAQTPYFSRTDLQSVVDNLDVVDLQGRRWTAKDFTGRIVLIDFWATWCAPCLAQMPELQQLREQHRADGFEILAISLNSSNRRDLIAWLNRQAVTWPQIHDGRAFSSPTARRFGVEALPASLLIGRDGKIVAENLRGERLVEAVSALTTR